MISIICKIYILSLVDNIFVLCNKLMYLLQCSIYDALYAEAGVWLHVSG